MRTLSNPFIKLINEGRINSPDTLKTAYRILVMKTHPDSVGSDRLLEGYLKLSTYYEEAKRVFENGNHQQGKAGKKTRSNHRLAYYKILHELEIIDKPYSFHRDRNSKRIRELKAEACYRFTSWNGRCEKLYFDADRDYDRLKKVKPGKSAIAHDLIFSTSPVFHNIVAYHLTGMAFYRKQVNQNLSVILQKLVEEGYPALKEFMEFLIGDMRNGPAVFGE